VDGLGTGDLKESTQPGFPRSEHYELERELGRGGMAVVFLAHDRKHGRRVAVKILHAELAAMLGPDRFVQEIRVLAALQHPHILGLIDSGVLADHAGELRGRPYYVMPYVEGETLRRRLEREGPLPVPEAVRIATEVAGALAYAELGALLPRAGGEYTFLRAAYGDLPAFLFGWMRIAVGGSGSIAYPVEQFRAAIAGRDRVTLGAPIRPG